MKSLVPFLRKSTINMAIKCVFLWFLALVFFFSMQNASIASSYTLYQYDQNTGSPSLNNRGQIAYIGSDNDVYLYDHNTQTKTRITSGGSKFSPSINDNGQIVWLYAPGPEEPTTVQLWDAGAISDIANASGGTSTFINNNGQVTFGAPTDSGTIGVYLWDKGIISNLLTPTDKYSYAAGINNQGAFAFQMFLDIYHCEAFIYSGGTIIQISDAEAEEQPYLQAWPLDINNLGHAIYSGNNGNLYFFNGITSTQVTFDTLAYAGTINNNDQIAFTDVNDGWFITLYSGGTFERITGNIYGWAHPDINDQGWIAWEDTLAVPESTPIPLPATVWLFGSGLIFLIGLRRFRRS